MIGVPFRMDQAYAPVPGCTVSCAIPGSGGLVNVFSLAAGTDISAEIYPVRRLMLVHHGEAQVICGDSRLRLREGQALLAQEALPLGVRTDAGTIYT